MVSGGARRTDRGAGQGLAGDRGRRSTLLLAPTGSGKTLAAFLAGARSPDVLARAGGEGALPAAVHLAAQGAGRRRRAQPAGARSPASPRSPSSSARRHRVPTVGVRIRRHAGDRARPHDPQPAGHPDHHAGVAVPAADQRGAVDPRRRSRRSSSTRSTRWSPASAAPTCSCRSSGSRRCVAPGTPCPADPADRAVGDAAAARRGRAAARRRRDRRRGRWRSPRPVEIATPAAKKLWDLRVEVPVEDMARLGLPVAASSRRARAARRGGSAGRRGRWDPRRPRSPIGVGLRGGRQRSIWPSIHPRLVALIREHRSTMIFGNSRRLAERLAAAINETAGEELALAHHGSVARDRRQMIEERLKRGELPAIVATTSLELGIDIGAVDLVVQIEAPPSVASGIQRIGRAGHQVGAVSRGILVPKFRGDLLACAAATPHMQAGRRRGELLSAQPARRPGAADRRGAGDGPVGDRRAVRDAAARGAVRRAAAGGRSRACSTCSRGAIRRTSSPSSGRGSCGTA